MPNSMLSDMEFEERLSQMGDNQTELIRFVARQQYQMSKLCPVHSAKIKALETQKKKEIGITGGVAGIVGVAIGAAIDFLLRRN